MSILSTVRRIEMQKGHDKHSLIAVCHALTRKSSFSPLSGVDAGSFPACFTDLGRRVRRLNYVRNIIDYSFVRLIRNCLEHLGHFRITPLLRFRGESPWIAIAIAFSPMGLSHKRPRLQAGHFTWSDFMLFGSKIDSINSTPITSFN